MKVFARLLIAIAMFSAAFHAQHHHSDPEGPGAEKSEKTNLVDEFGSLGHCDLTSRFDNFFSELSQRPDSVGYVLVYQSVEALPADYDAAPMERMFRNHMAFRNFDSSRVIVVNAGFRSDLSTQLWIVPPGGEIPEASDTVTAPVIPADRTFLYDRSHVESDETEDGSEFELLSVKEKRAQEMAAAAAEVEAETGSEDAPTVDEQPEIEAGAGEMDGEYVDTRTPEEIEADKFSWVSDKFGKELKSRKDSTGVLILYADDETLDIARLTDFIEQGKKRLSKSAGITPDRLTVRFGGYHDYPIIDYWIVPLGGKEPVPTPAERPVPEPEEATEN